MEIHRDIRLLQASIDADDISEFRIQISSHYIKYVTIAPGIYDIMDLVFEPTLEKILCEILPTGDWTEARVSMANRCTKDVSECILPIVEVSKPSFPGIRWAWHPVKIEYLDLKIGARLQSNVYQASHSCFSRPIIIKFARFAWEMDWLEAETAAYRWIDGHGIGPDFLGHVTEHGRVIGFMMSRVVENARHATPRDYIRCQEALQVLHGMKIKHGDINKHNFLLNGDGVTLIDFEAAVQNPRSEELRDELEQLGDQLNDTSGRGAPMASGEAR